jgi:outer membrane phospholipase A
MSPIPTIRKYKRENFQLSVSKSGKEQILQKKLIKDLKNCKYYTLKGATGVFSKLLNKDIFIKKTDNVVVDESQLRDYIKQKKVVDAFPEIYGYLKKEKELYVFQKLISDALNLRESFKILDKKDKAIVREQIKEYGNKLVEKGLLPWDFKLKNLIYSKKNKKVYIIDNAINFPYIYDFIDLCKKLKIHTKLSLTFKQKLFSELRQLKRKLFIDITITNLFNYIPKISSSEFRSKVYSPEIQKQVIKEYKSLSFEDRKKIQMFILNETLKEFK